MKNAEKRLLTKEERDGYAEKNISLVQDSIDMFSEPSLDKDEAFSAAMIGFTKALNTYMIGSEVTFIYYSTACMRNEIWSAFKRENIQSEKPAEKRLLTEAEKNEYAEENMKLVHYAANMYNNPTIDHDEFFSIALLGFTKALNSYLVGSNAKFSTYAIKCMRNEILYFLRKEKKHQDKTISDETVIYSDSSGNNFKLSDTVTANIMDENTLENSVLLGEDFNFIYEILDTLSDFEKEVITRRYGLGRPAETQSIIAIDLNMSQANISKIEQGILKKLYRRMKGKIEVEDNGYYKDI